MFEKALKIAIENGYFPSFFDENRKVEYDLKYHLIANPQNFLHEAIVLDPTFWQALSKGLNWINGHFDGKEPWLYHSLRYFDTLMSGNSENEFWRELIKEK